MRWPSTPRARKPSTPRSATHSDTYDDKPKFSSWADKKRKRVRICQMWIKRDDSWHFAEFTKGGILKAGPSPYLTDTGESDCELFFQSAFINRENERYGYVREMISPQDEINKRRSKTLHIMNSKQIVMAQGAVNDVEKARAEAARPDGVIVVNPPVNGGIGDNFTFQSDTTMAEGNFKLLVEAQNSIDLKGPNATMLGDKAQGSSSASGKAIIASQQGGMISLGDLTDNLRHLDLRVFRAIWNRIRQFWTAEKWVRTTDDERNIKWVALNVDRGQWGMLMQQDPTAAQRVAGIVGSVAELDCDIIIDEAPDNLTPQLEQFQALVELKKLDINNELPLRAFIETVPNLKNRAKFLELMDGQQQQGPPPELIRMQMEAEAKQQSAALDAQLAQQKLAVDSELAAQKQQQDAVLQQQKAAADITVQREKAQADSLSQREKAIAEMEIKRAVADATMAQRTVSSEIATS